MSLFSRRSRMNCQSDKNINCNRASMLHNSSTRRHARVRIVWINQGSSRSACLTCIWRREYQWIRAWRTHRPSVWMMESWVRFSAQSQAKERVFRYTNTHCMHVYSTTTTCTTWKCCTESWSHYRNNTVFSPLTTLQLVILTTKHSNIHMLLVMVFIEVPLSTM